MSRLNLDDLNALLFQGKSKSQDFDENRVIKFDRNVHQFKFYYSERHFSIKGTEKCYFLDKCKVDEEIVSIYKIYPEFYKISEFTYGKTKALEDFFEEFVNSWDSLAFR